MSILIKGMEMPENCGECLLAKLSPTGESLICNYMLSRVSWDERPFDCPLVPVPPHGRLIDADALYSHIKDEQRKCNDPYDGWSECQVALGFVNTAPTIIPANPAEEGE